MGHSLYSENQQQIDPLREAHHHMQISAACAQQSKIFEGTIDNSHTLNAVPHTHECIWMMGRTLLKGASYNENQLQTIPFK